MFEQGAVPGRVDADMYGAEAEDFSKDATHLDTWVFEKVKGLFKEARANATLAKALREDKNVFFLHLLGLDTTGHSFRPYSKEYLHNIKVVDQGVKEITELVEDFYGDGKTAFVFTADHGMSDWGSHGDGHPDNTRTPLIVWGSGVAPPVKSTDGVASGHEDGFSSDWNLNHIQRNDVSQADVAALMAYLVGIPFPVNSVGELPLAYLNADATTKAEALLVNAKEILEMYHVKEEQKKSTELHYRPFPAFSGNVENSVEHRIARIRESIDGGRAEEAIQQCTELIKLGLAGLRYLQTYDWLFLRALVTLGYLGWMAFAITTVIDLHVLHGTTETKRSRVSTVVFSSIGVALFSVLLAQRSRWTYYCYAVFPVMFWEEVYARRGALKKGKDVLFEHVKTPGEKVGLVVKFLASIGLLEAIVQSYFYREVFTISYILASVWPLFYGMGFVKQNPLLVATWWLSCVMMSVFTLLNPIKVEDLNLILVGGFLMFVVGALYLVFEKSIIAQSTATKKGLGSPKADALSRTILGSQVGLIALAMLVTKSSVVALQAKEGLPLGSQVVGWVVLVASLILPFLHGLAPNNHYIHRLVVIFLTFSPIFIILTISYEGLFYFAFCMTLVTWVRLEHRIFQHSTKKHASTPQSPSPPTSELNPLTPALASTQTRLDSLRTGDYRSLTLADIRIALFTLFLLQSAFFSTGNIASISSFSLDAVSRLIPVFDPFSQGALLMFKILVPFAVLSANLGILNRRLGVAPSALFMVVMAVGDVMTVSFFWMVRDEGSWLDIGTSISHFCIASGLCVFVAALEGVSEVFVSGVEFGGGDALVGKVGEKVADVLPNGVGQKVNGAVTEAVNGIVNGAAATANGGDGEALDGK
ncbi:Type I phosphodiesterase/nucleotide pyrophosphatase/phosphate transferase [Macrophomina phaseolina MS6]|uniref:GPI ethanolamine phosphate transferase 1 n=1 Tax=Macrophomina phaseolina (strain MS6) TaxID=1126212 RepID=K2RRQ7_MACPH|nr:Type I phosphodiesterase/nucleotide pyrophosphatase/phosphate transferase [Macrophomina phaseolina MS6]